MDILITLLIVVLILGIIWYVVETIPIRSPFKEVALVIVALIIIIYLVSMLPGVNIDWPK